MVALFVQCQTDPPVPKPRTYPRMIFPDRNPVQIDLDECPFSFQFADYSEIIRNKKFFDEEAPHPCWFDLQLPVFNADLFLSYHPVNSRSDFDDLIRDTYRIAGQINRRSDYMEEVKVRNGFGVGGMKFLFEGAAASPIHFYLTDTTQHFLKGALYYNQKVRPDSMMPATSFIIEDIDAMLSSFKWK